MLQFSSSAPYNAVHFIKISQAINISKLEESIQNNLLELGLGTPSFSNKVVNFYSKKNKITLYKCQSSIIDHAQLQLNQPFDKNDIPIRFYLINSSNEFYLSLTYNHWLADAYSIYKLIIQIISDRSQTYFTPLQLSIANNKNNFKYVLKYWHLCTSLAKSLYTFASAHRSHQKDLTASCFYVAIHAFPKPTLDLLKILSKKHQVTINDIFIAALARVFLNKTNLSSIDVKRKFFKPKRNKIIISVITNIRELGKYKLENIFNVFLGYFNLAFNATENITNETLLRQVNKKTLTAKKSQQALKNTLLFKIQSWYYKRSKNKYRLFHKNTPITVGISNMNLKPEQSSVITGEYIRFSPSGAICPVVFNFTTFNKVLILTITSTDHRFSKLELDDLKYIFIEKLNYFIK